jgi:hypothetical protein
MAIRLNIFCNSPLTHLFLRAFLVLIESVHPLFGVSRFDHHADGSAEYRRRWNRHFGPMRDGGHSRIAFANGNLYAPESLRPTLLLSQWFGCARLSLGDLDVL